MLHAGRELCTHDAVVERDVAQEHATRELGNERVALHAARIRITRIRATAAHEITRSVRLDDADRSATLVAVPRAQLRTLRIDVPHEQALAREEPVGADALAILEQQVVAATALHAVDGVALLHGRKHDRRIDAGNGLHTHPAELLLLPRTEMRGRVQRCMTAGAHEAPRTDALR